MANTKLATQLSDYKIEVSADDEIMALIDANTNHKYGKSAGNVLKCLALIAGGSPMATSCKLTGIPRATLQRWRSQEWYSRVIQLIQKQLDEQLDGKMTHVLNKGIDRLNSRLEFGDPHVSRTGEITYKPVSAKDAAIITSIFFDKRNLLRNKPTSISTKVSTDERLSILASRFKEIAIEADFDSIEEEITEEDVPRIEEITYSEPTREVFEELEPDTQEKESLHPECGEADFSNNFTFAS